MTLPFSDNNGEKKYSCFCCGVLFSSYDEFKDHIIQEHEQGREYVLCPLPHCKCPVRDVKLHLKVKHPSFDIKSFTGQSRAIVWYDFTSKGKRKTKKPRFKQGKYQSSKTGKILGYRSGLEEQVYKLLDADDDVVSFDAEPFHVDYIHKGQAHKYTPDIFVTFMDGHKEVWEIKPSDQTDLEKNKDKWYAAGEACKIRGWKFEVYTEQRINKLKNDIKRRIIE